MLGRGGDYYFHSFQSIAHLFLGTSNSFGGESDKTREVDERNVGGETETKSKLKRREDGWLIFTPSKSLKIEKHSDTSAPTIVRRTSFWLLTTIKIWHWK